MTGQTRFWYDDVDAMKNNNYLVRSKIDLMKGADHTGIVEKGHEYGNPNTGNIRNMVEGQRVLDEIKFRTDMYESLSRKGRNKRAQEKMFPKGPRQGTYIK